MMIKKGNLKVHILVNIVCFCLLAITRQWKVFALTICGLAGLIT